MDNSDLLVYAKEYATTQDLYELLGVTSDTPKPDIHRAWRKRSLKYHPDKAETNFDPEKWELFERARDVLSDAAAREIYDSQRSAAQLREQQRHAMDAKRRAMVEDLEARERGAIKRPRDDRSGATMSEAERRRLAEAGKRRLEERQRLMREAEARERQRDLEREREQPRKEDQQKPEPSSRRRTPDASSVAESKIDIDPEPSAQNVDGYDDQIADIERKIREARLRKAAKKDKKATRKNDVPGGDKLEAHQAKPTPDIPEELKADEKKEPSISSTRATKSFSFAPTTNASNNGNATTDNKPRAKGDFSSTMARLRAAQAEKEARKKAEEASTTTTGAEVGS
ncbi:DnaJ-domain-containing protein [Annulohypoxylon maeteangense]|uniref:DnaJ-domain-containing protein n=1 Tax=Annulohypoxylon maeteangense TaxID=1927788 RepID=UPI00200771C1|nr:DnaJ-domain-containing protein [Annulohypoxylon maeteangense]KAI0881852.1 DnaJ-domain-containing protein [Annulohypoxylon maeteangense]